MTDEDRRQYMEVLLALGGYNIKEEKKEDVCQQNCQSNPQSIENTEG